MWQIFETNKQLVRVSSRHSKYSFKFRLNIANISLLYVIISCLGIRKTTKFETFFDKQHLSDDCAFEIILRNYKDLKVLKVRIYF